MGAVVDSREALDAGLRRFLAPAQPTSLSGSLGAATVALGGCRAERKPVFDFTDLPEAYGRRLYGLSSDTAVWSRTDSVQQMERRRLTGFTVEALVAEIERAHAHMRAPQLGIPRTRRY